jgi:hypothetical protein
MAKKENNELVNYRWYSPAHGIMYQREEPK